MTPTVGQRVSLELHPLSRWLLARVVDDPCHISLFTALSLFTVCSACTEIESEAAPLAGLHRDALALGGGGCRTHYSGRIDQRPLFSQHV